MSVVYIRNQETGKFEPVPTIQGKPGATPQFEFEIQMGDPGSQPQVEQTGSAENPHVKFTIPQSSGSSGTGVPNGGSAGQTLVKQSDTDGDAQWDNPNLMDAKYDDPEDTAVIDNDKTKHALPLKLNDGKRHLFPTLASMVYKDDGTTSIVNESGLLVADDASKLGGKDPSEYAASQHSHDYAASNHTHSNYASSDHNHLASDIGALGKNDQAADSKKLDGKLPQYYYAGPPNYEYAGKDLSTVFASLADLHAAVSAGNFENIRVGDYWPITLSGQIYDYAASASKDCNCTFQMEVAGINTYVNYADTAPPNHLVMCSRNLLPFTTQYRSADTTWYSESETNPWRGSHLYQTLNNSTNGALALLNKTDFASYIYSGPNGSGMRFLLETKASGAANATSWGWGDRGKLFLPTEREVWGQDIWSEHSLGGGAAVQWPIFIGSLRHVVKGLGGSGRYTWWVQSSGAGSSSTFAIVGYYGLPSYTSASDTGIGAPLCFLFV